MAAADTDTTDRRDKRPEDGPKAEDQARSDDRPDGDAPSGEADDQPKQNILRRHPIAALVVLVVLLAVIAGAVMWWLRARHFETTDDAFIDARSVTIAPEVAGRIVELPVDDNQVVQQGDVLARIDPRNYATVLAQAEAQLAQDRATIANVEAQLAAQAATIEQARQVVRQNEATVTFAASENDRAQRLLATSSGSAQQAQQTATSLQRAQADLASAQAAVRVAERQVDVLDTQRQAAQAKLAASQAAADQARTDLDRTTLTAPETGRVVEIGAARGGYATAGQALMILVPDRMWITANFKETQLQDMRPGQPITISIDAYGGRELAGHVDSIQSGSGTAFSLLPAQNATGNYVKVVQRVPVKIVFDRPPDMQLGPGMSVVPSVRVR